MRDLENKVRYILDKFPVTRNSDTRLTLMIIHEFFPESIKQETNGWWVATEIMYDVREDHVKRIRAKLNEKGLFLADDPVVIKRRKQQEKWKDYVTSN